MFFRLLRVAAAVGVIFASAPLTVLAIERGFGLAATLIVPTCCLGFWWSVVSPRRSQRIGWFAFSSVCVLLLPSCPWWQRVMEDLLVWVQSFLWDSPFYGPAETVEFFALIIVPWSTACVLGWLAAKISRKLLLGSENESEGGGQAEYRFTLRGMLVSMMVCAALTAWLSGTSRQWHEYEDAHQEEFMGRFRRSFTTGSVVLLAEPVIAEDHSVRLAGRYSSGASRYQVVAPIKKNGRERWAVWSYVCYEEYPGTVSNFGYAEAASKDVLPQFPHPMPEYLNEITSSMVDGEPPLTTRAEIIDAPTTAKAGETITIVAQTDEWLECDLVIRPFTAVTLPPAKITAPPSGTVRWDVKLRRTYRGSQIEYEFQARTNVLYRAKTVGGVVALGKQNGDEESGEPQRLLDR